MKKYTISTFLRPAVLKDVFDNEGKGKLFYGKQFFFINTDGSLTGPHRVQESIIFKNQDYIQYFQLLSEKRLFIADINQFSETIQVLLKVKQVEETDIISSGRLIPYTNYFKFQNNEMLGPFQIKETEPKQFYHMIIKNLQMFVFDKAAVINKVEKKVNQLIS